MHLYILLPFKIKMKKLSLFAALSLLFFACGNNAGTQPAPTVSTPAVSTEADYKIIVPINDLQPAKNASPDDMGEIASDVGMYLIEAEDALKAKGYQVAQTCFVRDSVKIVDKSDKLLKYVSVKAAMKDECCGIVVAKTGKEPLFIPLDAQTANMLTAADNYFK